MLLLYVDLDIEIFITHCYTFYNLFILTIHDKIIMLMGHGEPPGKTVLPQGFDGMPLAD
jgi:hypothetical protein